MVYNAFARKRTYNPLLRPANPTPVSFKLRAKLGRWGPRGTAEQDLT